MYKLTVLLVITLIFQFNEAQKRSYKAAVVEISPKLEQGTPTDILFNNKEEYERFINDASLHRVDIVVFPEYGLQGLNIVKKETLDELSTVLPDPKEHVQPYEAFNSSYSVIVRDLSHAAKKNEIYVVINLIEKEYQDHGKDSKAVYYNTNVVFDRKGAIIAKYRKINLFSGEEFLHAGDKSQTSTFTTNFGVTFGIFTCFDIAFEHPSLSILKDQKVTDIVYPTAWFSILPFQSSLSIDHGYAVSNGVTLLAAGLNNPNETNGGSGIFYGDGRIARAYIKGIQKSKMLVEDIPIAHAQTPNAACENPTSAAHRESYGDGQYAYLEAFVTLTNDKSLYSYKSLNLSGDVIMETVCSPPSKFCCHFNITPAINHNNPTNYEYKLVAFHGAEKVASKSLGLRVCGLVACLNDSISTCGIRDNVAPTTIFEKISIGTVVPSEDAHDQPATVNFDLKPLIGYKYCAKKLNNGETQINVTTTERQTSLITFGILGRVYGNDNKPAGLYASGAALNCINYFSVVLLSVVVFYLQE